VATSRPFNLPSDAEADKAALATALSVVHDFALYFVVSDVALVCPRLMQEIGARLTDKNIQHIRITAETTNLLWLLQQELTNPLPDVIFVSGFENVISGSASPHSQPFLLNLNATRNNLYDLIPRPLVLWFPPYVLKPMLDAAPDFFSVRSGVYVFSLTPKERQEIAKSADFAGKSEFLGFSDDERSRRVVEMERLLSEFRSLPVRERSFIDEARILSQLGNVYTSLGDYTQGESLLVEALEVLRRRLPEHHLDISAALNNLASLYKEVGRYDEAQSLYEQALVEADVSRPMASLQQAIVLNNLGELYLSKRDYSRSEPFFNESLAILRSSHPQDQAEVAAVLHNLAAVYESQTRYGEAEAAYLDVLDVRSRYLVEEHPDIAATLNNLASLYKTLGRYLESEELFKRALDINRRGLPSDHPLIALALNNLASLYEVQRRHADALPLYIEALGIYRKNFPDGHPDIATYLNNLAGLYSSLGRFAESEQAYSDALQILRAKFGPDDKETKVVSDNFAVMQAEQEEHLLRLAERHLPISSQRPGVRDSSVTLTKLIPNSDHPRKKRGGKGPDFKPIIRRFE